MGHLDTLYTNLLGEGLQRSIRDLDRLPAQYERNDPNLQLNINIRRRKIERLLESLSKAQGESVHILLKNIYLNLKDSLATQDAVSFIKLIGQALGEESTDAEEVDDESEGNFLGGLFILYELNSQVRSLLEAGDLAAAIAIIEKAKQSFSANYLKMFWRDALGIYTQIAYHSEQGYQHIKNIVDKDDNRRTEDTFEIFFASLALEDGAAFAQVYPKVEMEAEKEWIHPILIRALKEQKMRSDLEGLAIQMIKSLRSTGNDYDAARIAGYLSDVDQSTFANEIGTKIFTEIKDNHEEALRADKEFGDSLPRKVIIRSFHPKLKEIFELEEILWDIAVATRNESWLIYCISLHTGTNTLNNRIWRFDEEERVIFRKAITHLYDQVLAHAYAKAANADHPGERQFFHVLNSLHSHLYPKSETPDIYLNLFKTNLPIHLKLLTEYQSAKELIERGVLLPARYESHLLTQIPDTDALKEDIENDKDLDKLSFRTRALLNVSGSVLEGVNHIIKLSTQLDLPGTDRQLLKELASSLIWKSTLRRSDTYFEEILKQLKEVKDIGLANSIVEFIKPYVLILIKKELHEVAVRLVQVLSEHLQMNLTPSTGVDAEAYVDWLLEKRLLIGMTQPHKLTGGLDIVGGRYSTEEV